MVAAGERRSPVAFHGGRVDIEGRVRTPDGQQELELPSLAAGQREDWLGRWAMNQMLINVSTRRLDKRWPGIAATILEVLDGPKGTRSGQILCVVRLVLPKDLRRSLACANIIENMHGTIRQVTRNVKRWRETSMAYKQLPTLKAVLLAHQAAYSANANGDSRLAGTGKAA